MSTDGKAKFDQKEYIQQYNAANYTRIVMDVRRETKRELMGNAKAAGMSLTAYLTEAGMNYVPRNAPHAKRRNQKSRTE